MRTSFIIILAFLSWAAVSDCLAQGESAIPFLLITPGAEANGMGEASVAVLTDDPVALLTNPAHLGAQSLRTHVSAGLNRADWLPRFQQSDLRLTTFALACGVNLREHFGVGPDIGVGVAYSRIRLNLGTFNVTGPDGPEPIATYNAYETADQYSLGVGIRSWVNVSAGLTLKHALSKIAPPMLVELGPSIAEPTVNMFDYGVHLQIPVVDIITRMRGSPVMLAPSLSTECDLNVGLARNNLGENTITYFQGEPGEPLPRTARAGIALNAALVFESNAILLRPFRCQWSVEADDILVRRYALAFDSTGAPVAGGWEYRGGLGDIKFFDELIAGHSNPLTVKKKGWQFELFETIAVRGGRVEEDPRFGGRNYTTSGVGVRFAGIGKLLKMSSPSLFGSGTIGFIVDHVDVRYNRSTVDSKDRTSPLQGTTFDAVNFLLSL